MAKRKRRKTKTAPPPDPSPSASRYFGAPHRDYGFVGVFVLALGARILHLAAIRDAPFWPLKLGDARSYDAWAHTIAAGDWLGAEIFYQAPLYPYFLGAVYTFLGDDLLAVRAVQAVIGASGCVLVALATRTLFSTNAALATGVVAALYAPAIFFDGLLQKSVLDFFLLSLLLWVLSPLLAAGGEASRRRLVATGVVLGLLALSRENALALLVPLLVWPVVTFGARKRAAALVLSLLLGTALVLVPVGVRNYLVGSEFLLTTSQLGPNLYIGNGPGADGTYRSLRPRRGDARYERDDAAFLAEQAVGRTLTPREISDYYVDEVRAHVGEEPGAWLRVMARKLVLTWNKTEVIDTEDPYAMSTYSGVLRWAGALFHFGVLLALALAGVWLSWGERRRLWLLYAFAAVYASSVVLFYVFARYRYPLVPILVIFAGVALVRAAPFWRETTPRGRAGLVAVSGLGLVVAYLPLIDEAEMRALTHYNWAGGLAEAGDADAAIEQYRMALGLDPGFAVAHNNVANLYLARGQSEQAFVHLERAVLQDDAFEDAHNNLANLLLDRGEPERAAQHARAALRLRPDYPEAANTLGNALAALGQREDARDAYERALELSPRYANAHVNLGTLLLEAREIETAKHHFTRATELANDSAQAWNNLGIAYAVEGETERAAEHFRRALEIDPTYEEARQNLARATR